MDIDCGFYCQSHRLSSDCIWGLACRHSRLAGSRDLEQWGSQMGSSIVDAYQQHVAAPLLTVRNELFQTFRQVLHLLSSSPQIQMLILGRLSALLGHATCFLQCPYSRLARIPSNIRPVL